MRVLALLLPPLPALMLMLALTLLLAFFSCADVLVLMRTLVPVHFQSHS